MTSPVGEQVCRQLSLRSDHQSLDLLLVPSKVIGGTVTNPKYRLRMQMRILCKLTMFS